MDIFLGAEFFILFNTIRQILALYKCHWLSGGLPVTFALIASDIRLDCQ